MSPRQPASPGSAIRRATPGDDGAVARLLHDFQDEFDEPSPGVEAPNAHSYLEEHYDIPDRRGQGIGRALMEAAMETARNEGATHMELGTSETDTAARALYERAGFTNRERKPDGPVMLFYEREL